MALQADPLGATGPERVRDRLDVLLVDQEQVRVGAGRYWLATGRVVEDDLDARAR